jgi:two-component system C4-dicarboxylate transport response regulator DctD
MHVAVDVRLVSASNVPLRRLVETGSVRSDFLYRVNVLRIEVPPLRERLADLPLLVARFLAEDAIARRCGITAVSDDVLAELARRPWPGNVRELHNVLRQAVVLGGEGGLLRSLGRGWEDGSVAAEAAPPEGEVAPAPTFRSWIRAREREYLADLVRRYPTTAQQAAASGLPPRTLYRKISRHGLRGGGPRGAGVGRSAGQIGGAPSAGAAAPEGAHGWHGPIAIAASPWGSGADGARTAPAPERESSRSVM